MLSEKRRGRHSKFGTIYFWCLPALFESATFLSLMRWDENYHLFILGALSFTCGWFGRSALRHRWRYWGRLDIAGMGLSLFTSTMENSFGFGRTCLISCTG